MFRLALLVILVHATYSHVISPFNGYNVVNAKSIVSLYHPTTTIYANGDDFADQVSVYHPTTTVYANGDDFADQVSIYHPTTTVYANGDDFTDQVSIYHPTTTVYATGDDFADQVSIYHPTTTVYATGDDFTALTGIVRPTSTSFANGDDFVDAHVTVNYNPPQQVNGQNWVPGNAQPYPTADPIGSDLYNTDANGDFTIVEVYVDPTIQTAIPNYAPGETFEGYNDTPETQPTPTTNQQDVSNDDSEFSEYDTAEALLYAQGVIPMYVHQAMVTVQSADSVDKTMRVVNAAGDVILVHFAQKDGQPSWTLNKGVLEHS